MPDIKQGSSRRYRTRNEILSLILKSANTPEGTKYTHILFEAKLVADQADQLLDMLLKAKMLKHSPDGQPNSRGLYATTDKGRIFIAIHADSEQLLGGAKAV